MRSSDRSSSAGQRISPHRVVVVVRGGHGDDRRARRPCAGPPRATTNRSPPSRPAHRWDRPGRLGRRRWKSRPLRFISVACGLSPFLYGFYDVSVWGPIALGMLAVLLGLLIARPAAPRRTALVACAGLAGFWLWSLFSSRWAESADQALDRGESLVALRGDVLRPRAPRLEMRGLPGSFSHPPARLLERSRFICWFGCWPGLLRTLFLDGRLHEPLGYVNGQAGFLLLGLWPMIALAERTERAAMAGAALAGATMLVSLALLGQSRAVLPAVGVAAAVLVRGCSRSPRPHLGDCFRAGRCVAEPWPGARRLRRGRWRVAGCGCPPRGRPGDPVCGSVRPARSGAGPHI